MFETQITTKGFDARVFKFTAIVTMNSSNNISIPLVLQPQDRSRTKPNVSPLSAKKKTQAQRE
jgi:hypothetical protein